MMCPTATDRDFGYSGTLSLERQCLNTATTACQNRHRRRLFISRYLIIYYFPTGHSKSLTDTRIRSDSNATLLPYLTASQVPGTCILSPSSHRGCLFSPLPTSQGSQNPTIRHTGLRVTGTCPSPTDRRFFDFLPTKPFFLFFSSFIIHLVPFFLFFPELNQSEFSRSNSLP